MLLPSEDARERRQAILRERADGRIDDREAGRRLIEVDPEYGPGWLTAGMVKWRAGDLDAAESLFWGALERMPSNPACYLPLSDVFRQRGDQLLSAALSALAFWKVSLADEIPTDIAESVRKDFDAGDVSDDPAFYAEAAEKFAANLGDRPWPERLLPYRLLNELQLQAESGLEGPLLAEIRSNATACAPVLRAALRESYDTATSTLSPEAECLVIGLLGELGGVDLLQDLLELPDATPEARLHAEWAAMRLGQRFPAEALARLRTVGKERRFLRSGVAQHLFFLRDAGATRDDVAALLDGFAEFAAEEDAPYLLLTVSTVQALMGAPSDGVATLRKHERRLSKRGRQWIERTINQEDGFVPDLIEIGIDSVDIEVVCRDLGLMPTGKVKDDWGEDEDFEEPDEGEAPVVKPGRNDPCWCGSGKKYKKCHLDQDERDEREDREGGDLFADAVGRLLDFSTRFHRKSDMERASRMFLGKRMGEFDERTAAESGFVVWYLYDFRATPGARTVVEEYLRRFGDRLDDRLRELMESWRDNRYGLWEVQRIEAGRGAEVRDLFNGETYFVEDVSTSRNCHRWDCIISRLHRFEGKWLFAGDGLLVPRPLLPRIRDEVEATRGAMTADAAFRSRSHEWGRFVREAHDEQYRNLRLVNFEGDPIEFSSAEYEVADGNAVASVLAGLPMFEDQTDEDDAPGRRVFGWIGEPDEGGSRRSYGHIEIAEGKLRLECNSRRRLQTGRALIEKYCGVFTRHVGDSFTDVEELKRTALDKPPAEPAKRLDPELERELVLKAEAAHYAKWPDTRLPALAGRTPRQAVRSKRGRAQVEELLRDFENASERARKEGRPAFDFSGVRAELGL